MRNKKGFEMSIGVIVAMVLAIVVLTILIAALTWQAKQLSSKVESQSSDSNIDEVVVACSGIVSSQALYAYCCDVRNVDLGGAEDVLEMTCEQIADAEWSGGRVTKLDCASIDCA